MLSSRSSIIPETRAKDMLPRSINETEYMQPRIGISLKSILRLETRGEKTKCVSDDLHRIATQRQAGERGLLT